MASISSKSIYGLSALLRLAENTRNDLIQIKDIAIGSNIPQSYLEQILPILKNFGFVESIRGANGGYRLAKSANDIVLYDVIMALEGGVCEMGLKSTSGGFEKFLQSINEEVKAVFLKNLAEVIEFVKKNDEKDFVYHI